MNFKMWLKALQVIPRLEKGEWEKEVLHVRHQNQG